MASGQSTFRRTAAVGSIAGLLSVFLFHQTTSLLVVTLTGSPAVGYSLAPVNPLQLPAVLNLVIWAGLWGAVIWPAIKSMPTRWPVVVAAFVIGAIGTTVVGWTITALAQKIVMTFSWGRIWRGPLNNGMFAVGVALLAPAIARRG
jgi:hypothetical protein